MAEAGPGAAGGYVAFISYSHKDAAMGRWLHRKLEGYRLPKRLAGTQGEDGEVPARLIPIFRDRDELPAAGDLSERVRAALAVSRNLIVLCSPNSAASPWVAKEIATFRELHPGRPIFTAIVEGEPGQCFSPALLEGGTEPLAADLRKDGDGRRLGLLKLVAGLAGVGLDALVQRDAQRRVRNVTGITFVALSAMIVMAFLTMAALRARTEAERQRTEAEGLVEFMLTDLRDRLKGVGRLDVLTAVNQRALDYYQKQELSRLPPGSLERRARILHLMGEDDMSRGQPKRAISEFREAARTTGALLAEEPNNPDRIFAHAQSEFWVAFVDYNAGNYAQAKPAFRRYKHLADRLVDMGPHNPDWIKEAGYAEGSLCSIALAEPVDAEAAIRACSASLKRMEYAAKLLGTREDMSLDLANRHAWLADAFLANGDRTRAWAHRRHQEQLIKALRTREPHNMDIMDMEITVQLGIAKLERLDGHRDAARARLERTQRQVDEMVKADPKNSLWATRRERVRLDLRALQH